jgi:replicative DNA helicase
MTAVRHALNALLGGLLIDGEATLGVSLILPVDAVTEPRAREAYAAMVALAERGEPVDFVTVCCELERRGTLETVGEARLIETINRCPTSLYVEDYARIVRQGVARYQPAPRRSLAERLGLGA